MQGSGLEWRLESGALLRCWKPYKGDFFNYLTANRGALGMHHYDPSPHMTENLVHPPVLQYRAISRNLRLFWDALGVICAWVPLGLAGGVVRGVNGGRRARSRPNLVKFQNLRTRSGVDEL